MVVLCLNHHMIHSVDQLDAEVLTAEPMPTAIERIVLALISLGLFIEEAGQSVLSLGRESVTDGAGARRERARLATAPRNAMTTDTLTIAHRVWAEPQAPRGSHRKSRANARESGSKGLKSSSDRKMTTNREPEYVLFFDTETTMDCLQNLDIWLLAPLPRRRRWPPLHR